jgi:hypothetical protein
MAEEEKEIMLKETTMGNQTKKPEFPYFYGNEADSYSFFIVPRILFKAKPFMIVGVIFSLISILAGVLMIVIGKSKGWDSSKALPFYIAYFLYPVFLAAYTAVTVYRKTHPKK